MLGLAGGTRRSLPGRVARNGTHGNKAAQCCPRNGRPINRGKARPKLSQPWRVNTQTGSVLGRSGQQTPRRCFTSSEARPLRAAQAAARCCFRVRVCGCPSFPEAGRQPLGKGVGRLELLRRSPPSARRSSPAPLCMQARPSQTSGRQEG